jgi:hypothetical protein
MSKGSNAIKRSVQIVRTESSAETLAPDIS